MTCIKSLQLLSIVICCTQSHTRIDLGQRKKIEIFGFTWYKYVLLNADLLLVSKTGQRNFGGQRPTLTILLFQSRKWFQWGMLLFFFSPQGHGYYMFLFFGLIFKRWQCIKLCMLRRWRLYKRAKSGRINRQRFKTFLDHVQAHVLCTVWKGQPCGFETSNMSPSYIKSWLKANMWLFVITKTNVTHA